MAGFADRLAGLKAKQESKVAEKTAAEAAEQAAREKETKKGELQEQQTRVAEEFESAQKEAQEGENAVAEADAFAAEQGEALDAEVKAEMDALKVEAGEAKRKFEELQTRLQEIDAELAKLEGASPEAVAEAPAETAAEVATAEVPVEGATEEKATEATVEAVEARELTNDQVLDFAREMEALNEKSAKATTAEEVESVFQTRVAMLDKMKGAKFPDTITAPDGTTESGKEFEDSIKSGESLESFKLARDVRLEGIKAAQMSAEAPAEKPTGVSAEASNNGQEMAKFVEGVRQRQEQRKELRQNIGAEFQAAIDADESIPDEWKESIQETITKELIGNEKGQGNISSYPTERDEIYGYGKKIEEGEETAERVRSLDYIPAMWKVLDPEISQLAAEKDQSERDVKSLENTVRLLDKKVFRIYYHDLPKDLREKMEEEWEGALKEGRGAPNEMYKKHSDIIRRELSDTKRRINDIKTKLKEKSKSLTKHPKYVIASDHVSLLHKKMLERLHA